MKKLLLLSIIVVCSMLTVQAESGKELYDKSCAKCHGVDGAGKTKMGQKLNVKDYTDAKVQESFNDEKAFKIIREGSKKDGRTLMKASEDLSDTEIKALVAYVRSFKK